MREIIRVLCGSHLYGVALPSSDEDVKGVFVPSAQDILLGRSKDVRGIRSDDQDLELFSLQRFLRLLCEGQTVVMDMIFAPAEFYRQEPSAEWQEIVANRSRFLSKNCKAFVGYCRQQAQKYVVRKERLRAVDNAVSYLASLEDRFPNMAHVPLRDVDTLERFVEANCFTELVGIETAQGAELQHLSVCETMVPVSASIKTALATYRRKAQEYGQRIRGAQEADTLDWKSLYHAVRVAGEAIELMETGKITFPRPDKDLLLDIRQGKLPFETVSRMIEENLIRVEEAVQNSALPEKPDYDFADRLVEEVYRQEVLSSRP